MYTVVLKQKSEDLIIFDVFKKPLLGRQRIIGNVTCKKIDGEYKASSTIYMASWKNNIKYAGGRTDYCIEEMAISICNYIIDDKY